MATVHTHYDNLKVTRNAPLEVIRAAYKTLTQKYHPDKHPGNIDAERVMALINVSYQVLSDPMTRADHDRWIRQQEQAAQSTDLSVSRPSTPPPATESVAQRRSHYQPTPPRSQSSTSAMRSVASHVRRNWVLYAIAGFFVWIWANPTVTKPPIGPKLYQASRAPEVAAYVKPATAPNGQLWPAVAGYIKGYEQLNANGLSTVTVDNSRNDSEVFVKLVSLDGSKAYPVRQFFIPAFGSFSLKKVTAGSYDVRYRDLGTGGLSRSEAVTLREVHSDEGAQYSNLTMTLYKVKNGNMKTYGLSEAEF